MSKLLSFYRGDGVDAEGRRFDEILAWDDEDWEAVHDYIQWLFPTTTRSAFNANAPELIAEGIAAFQSDEILRSRLRQSFERFLRFAGLQCKDDQIQEGENFEKRADDIWTYENHNWLRISRVLECLRLFGMNAEADAFLGWLESAYQRGVIGGGDAASRAQAANSLAYWQRRCVKT